MNSAWKLISKPWLATHVPIWSLWRGEMVLGIGFAALAAGLTYYLRHLRRFIGR